VLRKFALTQHLDSLIAGNLAQARARAALGILQLDGDEPARCSRRSTG